MESAFEAWKEIVKVGSYVGTSVSTGTTTAGGFYMTPTITPGSVEITATFEFDEKWIGTTVEDKPEPVKPAKPVKRYSKKVFKKKLKELCG